MSLLRGLTDRLKLQHMLFVVLLASGIVPLAIISSLLISQNRDVLETQEKSYLTASARALSLELDAHLRAVRLQLRQVGDGVLAVPEPTDLDDRVRAPWVARYLEALTRSNHDLLSVRVVTLGGLGSVYGAQNLPPSVVAAMDGAARSLMESPTAPIHRFVVPATLGQAPLASVAIPVRDEEGRPVLIVDGLAQLPMLATLFGRERDGGVAVFLVDRDGTVLWAGGTAEAIESAMQRSEVLRDFVRQPLAMTQEYELVIGEETRRMQAQVSPVAETGWGVVVQKPVAEAFPAVREMIFDTLLSTVLLLLLALLLALVIARKVSRPIRRLARTSHEIATGNFGQRVEEEGLGLEVGTLARDFNRMSDYVQRYVEELRRAAKANRDLFIGSIRAFAAAIDAKDPYTRGHSERVAEYSRTIARYLDLPDEVQQRVWVGALLHDVGKIGIDDRVLKKGGTLTDDEFALIKKHPSIGAEILLAIDQLHPMIPAVRSHHEAWNGAGYPEGLAAEDIPLMARIVGVADCFDAITTHRPYQRGLSHEYAVETVTKLAGKKFDAKVVTAFLKAVERGEIRDTRRVRPPSTASEPIDAEAASLV